MNAIPPLSIFQRLCSYFWPIKVLELSSPLNPTLYLKYYQGQWLLETEDAIYSEGTRYRPLVLGFQKIKPELGKIQRVLMLGCGLGSGAMILQKMGFSPSITLVDKDPVILTCAQKILPESILSKAEFIATDAQEFLATSPQTYDLIVVDIFKGRKVPDFITSTSFLETIAQKLYSPKGIVLLNYIVQDNKEAEKLIQRFSQTFRPAVIHRFGLNRILIGYHTS